MHWTRCIWVAVYLPVVCLSAGIWYKCGYLLSTVLTNSVQWLPEKLIGNKIVSIFPKLTPDQVRRVLLLRITSCDTQVVTAKMVLFLH